MDTPLVLTVGAAAGWVRVLQTGDPDGRAQFTNIAAGIAGGLLANLIHNGLLGSAPSGYTYGAYAAVAIAGTLSSYALHAGQEARATHQKPTTHQWSSVQISQPNIQYKPAYVAARPGIEKGLISEVITVNRTQAAWSTLLLRSQQSVV